MAQDPEDSWGRLVKGRLGNWQGRVLQSSAKGGRGMGRGTAVGEWSGKAEEEVAHIFFFLSLLLLSSKRTWLF